MYRLGLAVTAYRGIATQNRLDPNQVVFDPFKRIQTPAQIAAAAAEEKKKKSGKVTIENVPPEEFLISKKARTIADSPFVAHRQMLTRSTLVAMGFNKKQIEGLQMGDALAYTPERVARYAAGEQPYQTQTDDPSMQEIEVFEHLQHL